ncbi:MAG: hypothetical protein VYC33_00475 [Candidatus Thermoplasmatota archaeon]|nr:hypothetical protein [Candidatus Thermoplasmatota archaeon]
MSDVSQSDITPNPEGAEVLYVQGVSNPSAVGQYPQTQAVVAMVLSVLSIAAGCGLCTAIPGLMMANTALDITSKHPGHPDQGIAKAAQVVGWIGIVLGIIGLILVVLYFILIGIIVANAEA